MRLKKGFFRTGFQLERQRLLLGFVFLVLTALAGIGLLALSGWFITTTAVVGLTATVVLIDVFTPGTGIRFFALLRTVARYFERVIHHDAVLRIQAWWRNQLFSQLTQRSPAQFLRVNTASMLQRLTQDLNTLDAWYLRLIAPPRLAALALVVVWLLIVLTSGSRHFWLHVLTLSVFVLLWLLAGPISQRLTNQQGRGEVRQQELIRQTSLDLYDGGAELKTAGLWQDNTQRLLASAQRLNAWQQHRLQRLAFIDAVISATVQGLAVVILLYGLNAYLAETLSLPIVVLHVLAVLALAELMQPVAEQAGQVGLVNEARARIHDSFTLTDTSNRRFVALPLGQSVRIAPQQITAVIGASGMGKSTIGQMAAGLLPNTGQVVYADSTWAEQVGTSAWLQSMGYMAQANLVLSGTIAANLRIAAPQASIEQLWQALDFACLKAEVSAMPAQLDTWVGTAGTSLSGGQARRLMLARLYLQNPDLVILDEPFTGIDRHTQTKLMTNVTTWLRGKTALVLGHDLTSLPVAGQVVNLDG